jgi:hypothetical protein
MSEGLQMTLIIQDSGWKDGIEGAEKRSHGQVAPAECVRATSKEERANCHMGGLMATIRSVSIDSAM